MSEADKFKAQMARARAGMQAIDTAIEQLDGAALWTASIVATLREARTQLDREMATAYYWWSEPRHHGG